MVVQSSFVPEDEQCSETDLALILTLLQLLVFEIWSILYSRFLVNCDLRDFCKHDSETLTSDT